MVPDSGDVLSVRRLASPTVAFYFWSLDEAQSLFALAQLQDLDFDRTKALGGTPTLHIRKNNPCYSIVLFGPLKYARSQPGKPAGT